MRISPKYWFVLGIASTTIAILEEQGCLIYLWLIFLIGLLPLPFVFIWLFECVLAETKRRIILFFSIKAVTREQAADLIDEFIDTAVYYSEYFDMAFDQHYEDPLLDEIAKEFRRIQKAYELDGLKEADRTKLIAMSKRLRDNLP